MAIETTMDDRTIRTRLDFLGFTASDAELLKTMKLWADSIMKEFVKEFYDYQFKDPEFSSIIRSNGGTQEGLEAAQAGYARMLFDGYPDMGYVSRRMAIGELHARINITPQWYITSYHFYFDMFYPRVREEAGDNADQAVSAVNKLLNFDQSLTYIKGLMDSMRGLVTQVASTAVNLAEAIGQLSSTAEQAGQAVQGIASTSQEVARSSEEQSAKSTEVTNGMGQLSRAIEQVAQGSQQQASAVEQASAKCVGLHSANCRHDF